MSKRNIEFEVATEEPIWLVNEPKDETDYIDAKIVIRGTYSEEYDLPDPSVNWSGGFYATNVRINEIEAIVNGEEIPILDNQLKNLLEKYNEEYLSDWITEDYQTN